MVRAQAARPRTGRAAASGDASRSLVIPQPPFSGLSVAPAAGGHIGVYLCNGDGYDGWSLPLHVCDEPLPGEWTDVTPLAVAAALLAPFVLDRPDTPHPVPRQGRHLCLRAGGR